MDEDQRLIAGSGGNIVHLIGAEFGELRFAVDARFGGVRNERAENNHRQRANESPHTRRTLANRRDAGNAEMSCYLLR